MKCVLCDKEISRSYSNYGNYCKECSEKIKKDLKSKNFNEESTPITTQKENIQENPFSAYNPSAFNDYEPSNYYENEAADSLNRINSIIGCLNIIGSLFLIFLYFTTEPKPTYFLILGITGILGSLLLYRVIKGIVEIIEILDNIKRKMK